MINISEFSEQYDSILEKAKELLVIRQELLEDPATVQDVDSLKPYHEEEMMMASALINVRSLIQEQEKQVSCGSCWVTFHIPYFAFNDVEKWKEHLLKQKEIMLTPVEGEDIPEWLSSLPEDD